MSKQQTIKCAFCKGTGDNPHYSGACPVCKGKGKNQVVGRYMTCDDCHGSGQKADTTLTCYHCGGLGMVADTREVISKAREEIKKAREEIAREIEEFQEKPVKKKPHSQRSARADAKRVARKTAQEDLPGEDSKARFCQCCASEVTEASTVKICLDCFKKTRGIEG